MFIVTLNNSSRKFFYFGPWGLDCNSVVDIKGIGKYRPITLNFKKSFFSLISIFSRRTEIVSYFCFSLSKRNYKFRFFSGKKDELALRNKIRYDTKTFSLAYLNVICSSQVDVNEQTLKQFELKFKGLICKYLIVQELQEKNRNLYVFIELNKKTQLIRNLDFLDLSFENEDGSKSVLVGSPTTFKSIVNFIDKESTHCLSNFSCYKRGRKKADLALRQKVVYDTKTFSLAYLNVICSTQVDVKEQTLKQFELKFKGLICKFLIVQELQEKNRNLYVFVELNRRTQLIRNLDFLDLSFENEDGSKSVLVGSPTTFKSIVSFIDKESTDFISNFPCEKNKNKNKNKNKYYYKYNKRQSKEVLALRGKVCYQRKTFTLAYLNIIGLSQVDIKEQTLKQFEFKFKDLICKFLIVQETLEKNMNLHVFIELNRRIKIIRDMDFLDLSFENEDGSKSVLVGSPTTFKSIVNFIDKESTNFISNFSCDKKYKYKYQKYQNKEDLALKNKVRYYRRFFNLAYFNVISKSPSNIKEIALAQLKVQFKVEISQFLIVEEKQNQNINLRIYVDLGKVRTITRDMDFLDLSFENEDGSKSVVAFCSTKLKTTLSKIDNYKSNFKSSFISSFYWDKKYVTLAYFNIITNSPSLIKEIALGQFKNKFKHKRKEWDFLIVEEIQLKGINLFIKLEFYSTERFFYSMDYFNLYFENEDGSEIIVKGQPVTYQTVDSKIKIEDRKRLNILTNIYYLMD